MIVIRLDGEPKGKGRPRFSRKNGVAFTPTPTRNYEAALRMAAQVAMVGKVPLAGPLRIQISANFSIPQSWSKKKQAAALMGEIRPTGKPDFDNLAKTADALNKIVWNDDAQVVDASITKHYTDKPHLSILVHAA